MKEDDLFLWKFGQMSRSRAYSAAAKGKGGIAMDPGETAIRAGNTVAWYDASDATTITKDGSNLVSLWADKLVSGHDLKAATTKRPTWSSDTIIFNGTANMMKTDAFTYAQPEQIYLVLKQVTNTINRTFIDGNTNNSMRLLQTGTANAVQLYGATGTVTTELILDTFTLITILFNGNSSSLQIGSNAAKSGVYATTAAGAITLGDTGANAGYYCRMTVKEAIFRNIADDATTRAAIQNYLNTKHSL